MDENIPAFRSQSSQFWFALFVGVVCVWVLSLPIFPAQDSPMHRYYTHALGQVIAHQPQYSVYSIRHPFPPYATQYITLLALSRLFSFDLAEKISTCAEILCFAYGLRLCATGVGPAGAWVSLLIAPLLLPWYLMMGFYNYSIGLGLALFAAGFWLRFDRSIPAMLGFAAAGLVLSFSHPVPLGLLVAFLVGDLLRRRFLIAPAPIGWLKANGRQLAGFLYALVLSLLPSLSFDHSQNPSTVHDIGFHLPFLRTVLLLTGLSPYNTRSHSLWINGYRLALYTLLILAFIWGVQVLRRSLAARQLSAGATFLIYAVLLAILLPFLPDRVSGGGFFAMRMVILVWVFALLAAAGRATDNAMGNAAGGNLPRLCIALGAVFTVLTLVPAERTLRPIAKSVHRMELEPLPVHTRALLLNGPMLNPTLRFRYDVAFNPFMWANMLPIIQQNDLVVDAPWLQLSTFPLHVTPGAMVAKDPSAIIELIAQDPPPRLNILLPAEPVRELIRESDIIAYAGTDEELGHGLVDYLGPHDAAEFTCRRPQSWSLLCVRKEGE